MPAEVIADQPCGYFDDTRLERDAELLDEQDFIFVGDRKNSHRGIGIWPFDEFPMTDFMQNQPARCEKSLQRCHCRSETQ